MSFVILFFKDRETRSNIASPESPTPSEESNDEDIFHLNKITDKML